MHVESHDFRGWSPPDEPWNSGGGRIDVFASQKRRWLSFKLRPNCDFDRRPMRAAHVSTRLYIYSLSFKAHRASLLSLKVVLGCFQIDKSVCLFDLIQWYNFSCQLMS